jgi:HAD superfamily phosphoserine phosphatase-like hydrolase
LLRGDGFKYSWQLVWKHLGYHDDMRRRFFAQYENRQLSYEEWCRSCAFYFRERGLERSHFAAIASEIRPTRKIHEALRMLRYEGISVGVISGGIDTLLESVLPDHAELFDFVYINEFEYDGDGRFVGIRPTKYDFERKVQALEIEVASRDATLENAIFVGEGGNDRFVIEELNRRGTGLTIAYPARSTEVEIAADRVIEEDDLTLVSEMIIREL